MSLKWSPPKPKTLTQGGSTQLTPSTTSKLNISTKTTASSTYIPQSQNEISNKYQQQSATHKQQHNSAPLKLSSSAKNLSYSSSLKRPATNESTNSSMLSVYSTNSTNALLTKRDDDDNYGLYHKYNGHNQHQHHYHHHFQQQQQHQQLHNHLHSHHGQLHATGRGGGSGGGGSDNRFSSSLASKRGKKQNWQSRERAGMSFLIVIIFFAVFGIIILMELFMIDDRAHSGIMMVRHANNYGSRSGDSMPDYDNVKDDYDLLDENLLSDNKLGFVQFRDNKLKIQDADGDGSNGRVAGILLNSGGSASAVPQRNDVGAGAMPNGGIVRAGGSMSAALIPWGKILPAKVEETLPHFPIGVHPIDGAWQVVNGTRFKFFVFSAYYDRRDGAKLVRVIGATKTRTPERVWCRFWYPRGQEQQKQRQQNHHQQPPYLSATVMARVKVIRENWNLKYSAVFVLCPVRPAELEVPHYVSIVARLRAPPGNLLNLRNTDWDPDFAHLRTPPQEMNSSIHSALSNSTAAQHQHQQKQQQPSYHHPTHATMSPLGAQYLPFGLPTDEQIPDKIAVCVKPFHFNYDQALYLMEFLEFYALMGVAHFTFYNHTLGPHATCVLQHYIDGDVPNISSAWDVDLAEVLGKGMTLMGQDAAKVDAVLSGYYNADINNNNNFNINNNVNINNVNNKNAAVNSKVGNLTKAHLNKQTKTKTTLATAFEGEITGALQPPPTPPPPPAPALLPVHQHSVSSAAAQQSPQLQQMPQLPPKPPLQQPTLPPVKRYKSLHYSKPTINILPWNLRMRSQKEIRTEGLFAALNDCLYRTMHRYRYLAMVDLDEFIVPRHNDTLNELINSLNHRFRYRNLGAYSFQNAFFYLQFPDDPLVTLTHLQQQSPPPQGQQQQQPYAHTNPILRSALVTQRKTRRRLKLHPQKQRSKYICKPEAVIEAGNHFVWEFSPAKGSLNVPPTDGILQHYRVCEFGGNDCIKSPSVVDRTATKYVNRLVERVELVYKHLKKRCDLPPLPNEPTEEQHEQQQQQKQQRKLQSKHAGELSKENTIKNTKSDDERIKTLANVKTKRDNDNDNDKGAFRNGATNKGNDIDPTTHDKYYVKRKQRKVVVFDQDEEGIPIARLEYVDV